jgi:hypothetical protein
VGTPMDVATQSGGGSSMEPPYRIRATTTPPTFRTPISAQIDPNPSTRRARSKFAVP